MPPPPPNPGLPIDGQLPEIVAALGTHRRAVVVAEPGAGKTTAVPRALLDAPWRGDSAIVMLEPRRVAARAAANRLAQQLGERVGGTVGLRMRHETVVSDATRIVVCTEGTLVRWMLRDPELAGVGVVVFDEFHERSLDADVAFALSIDCARVLRPDLRLLVMSATLDDERVGEALAADGRHAPVIRVPGRTHPVDIRYRPSGTSDPADAVAAALPEAWSEHGDVLVFLPGAREIRRVARRISGIVPPDVDVVTLHGGLDAAAQADALMPAGVGRRRVVLATSVAQTSVTLPGVRVVIDSGWSRLPRRNPATGLTRLATSAAARATADQRAGRAGRVGPGVCLRLWSASEHRSRPQYEVAEILDSDLCGVLLTAAAWGTRAESLTWLDPPPPFALDEARAWLHAVGAVDAYDTLTDKGARLIALPLDVRMGALLIGAEPNELATAVLLAASLTEGRLIRFGDASPATDLRVGVQLVHTRDPSVDEATCRRIARTARELATIVGTKSNRIDPKAIGRLLLRAWPERLAACDNGADRYRFASGAIASLPNGDLLAGTPLLVAADVDGDRRAGRIWSAAPVTVDDVVAVLGTEMSRAAVTTLDNGRVSVLEQISVNVGAARLVIATQARTPIDAEIVAAVCSAVGLRGIGVVPLASAHTLRARVQLLRRVGLLLDANADLSDSVLLARLDEWLVPALHGAIPGDVWREFDASGALAAFLGPANQRLVDRLAPTHLGLAHGRERPISYDTDSPSVAARLQDLLGTTRHPTIADGRIPLVLHLLSPAGRPIQVTADLPGFWNGSYARIRGELRGRYPKHAWPQDPTLHPPPPVRRSTNG